MSVATHNVQNETENNQQNQPDHSPTTSRPAPDAGADALFMVGQVVHVDPTTLLFDVNVRAGLRLDPAFVASIKEHGVCSPMWP